MLSLTSKLHWNFSHAVAFGTIPELIPLSLSMQNLHSSCMQLNTLPVVSIYLWHNSKCSCWLTQSHTELWLNSVHLNFRIVYIKERTSKFCIITKCLKMVAVSSFMCPINLFLFQLNFLQLMYLALNYLWSIMRPNSTQLNQFYNAIMPIYVNFVYLIYSRICSKFSWLLKFRCCTTIDNNISCDQFTCSSFGWHKSQENSHTRVYAWFVSLIGLWGKFSP